MKVYPISSINGSKKLKEKDLSPSSKAAPDWGKIGSTVSKEMKWLPKFLAYVDRNNGELLNASVTAIGTAFVAPIFIINNPLAKEDKDTKWYTAMRQPISAIITFFATIFVNNKFNHWLYRLGSTGKLGPRADLSAAPNDWYLSHLAKFQNPQFSKKELKEEVERLRQKAERDVVAKKRVEYRDKIIKTEDLVSAEALSKAKTNMIKDYEPQLKGKSKKEIKEFIKNNITPDKVKEKVMKEIEWSVERDAKAKFEIRQLKDSGISVEEAIKQISARSANTDKEKDIIKNILSRLKTIQEYESINSLEAFSSVKNLGKTYDRILHNTKVKRLVKAQASDAKKVFSQYKNWCGIVVSLTILPFSCGFLNWVYPRVMEKVMPTITAWIHRNDENYKPEGNSKVGNLKLKVEDDDED